MPIVKHAVDIYESLLITLASTKSQHSAANSITHSRTKSFTEYSAEDAKQLLVTLHFLFPHELLPALDLIDRKLIFMLNTDSLDTKCSDENGFVRSRSQGFYVQSASSTADLRLDTRELGRLNKGPGIESEHYEVNLDSWNCTCPAFAYSAMRLFTDDNSLADKRNVLLDIPYNQSSERVIMGGDCTRDQARMPICKHMLAVILIKTAPQLFSAGLQIQEAEKEKLAEWASK